MNIQKLTNALKWFLNKIDFVARNRAEGKTYIGSIRVMSWYRLVAMLLLSLLFLSITFNTEKPGAYQMRWVAIGIVVFTFINVLIKLFLKPKLSKPEVKAY